MLDFETRLRRGVVCAHHQDTDASFGCPHCQLYFCDSCVDHHFRGDGFVDRCRRCHTETIARPAPTPADIGTLLSRLGEIPRFPFQRSVLAILTGLALIVAPINWAIEHNISGPLAFLGWVIVTGIELSVLFHFVHQSASGAETFSSPDFRSVDSIYEPLGRIVAAFLPFIALTIWALVDLGTTELTEIASSSAHLGLTISAFLIFPLLLVIASIGRGRDVINPIRWAEILHLLGARYWIAAILFYLLAGSLIAWKLVATTWLIGALPFAGRLLGLFGAYCIAAMISKLFGLLLQPHLE